MMQSRWIGRGALGAWVLALVACGGGGNDDGPSPTSLAQLRQASAYPTTVAASNLLKTAPGEAAKPAVRVSQAQAPAQGQAPAALTATAFFDWAERTFPEFFPGQQTDRLLLPYVYRHYPATDIYLAVNGELIYALGPVTGNQVVALGKLSDFTCLVSPASCAPPPEPVGSGLASDCFNVAVYVPGTTYQWDFQMSGGAGTGVMSTTGSIARHAASGGYADVNTHDELTTMLYSAPLSMVGMGTVTIQSTDYFTMEGSDLIVHGRTSISNGAGLTTTVTATNQPAARYRSYSLAVGESSTTHYAVTSIVNGVALPTIDDVPDTVTYLGQELVSVPAGTFKACKFKYSGSTPFDSIHWIATTSGVRVKTQTNDANGPNSYLELMASSRLNGASIAP